MILASQTDSQCLLWRYGPSEVLFYLMSKTNAFKNCEVIKCDADRETPHKGVEGQHFRQRILLFCTQLHARVKIMIEKLRLKKTRQVFTLSKLLRYCSN